jgi:elongation factor 1-gamma
VTAQDPETTLLGGSPQEYATIVQWLSFANSELMPALGHGLRPLLGADPYDCDSIALAKKVALKVTETLEKHLSSSRSWLKGEEQERLSLVDVFVASMLARGLQFVLDKEWRKSHPVTMGWFERVTELEWVKKVVEVKMCEETIEYVGENVGVEELAGSVTAGTRSG